MSNCIHVLDNSNSVGIAHVLRLKKESMLANNDTIGNGISREQNGANFNFVYRTFQ